MVTYHQDTEPDRIARLLTLHPAVEAWTSEDLKQILQHQLHAELEFDLKDIVGIGNATVLDLRWQSDPAIITFGDLLNHPNPPLPLLQLLKEYGKDIAHQIESEMPADIGRVLYYAAIGLAYRHHRARISSLAEEDLAQGFRWAHQLPWICPPFPSVFESAMVDLRMRS